MDEALAYLEPWLPLATPWAIALGLALARVGGLMLALPNLRSTNVPNQVKGAIAIAIASSLIWLRPLPTFESEGFMFALVLAAGAEFALGLALGFVLHIGFATIRLAGQLIGVEMGLSFAAIADPLSQSQGTVMSALFGQLGVQLFLALGLDRAVILALADSIMVQPLGTATLSEDMVTGLVRMGDAMFRSGLAFALPVAGALFAVKLAMALLARVAPRIQLFTLTFTLTLLVGQLVMVLAFPSVGAAVARYLETIVIQLRELATLASNA